MGDGKMQVFFNVPANKCGLVIGKGGETIRQINSECDVHCELDRNPQPNPMEKTFVIRGHPVQIDMAKRMICEKTGMVSGIPWLYTMYYSTGVRMICFLGTLYICQKVISVYGECLCSRQLFDN